MTYAPPSPEAELPFEGLTVYEEGDHWQDECAIGGVYAPGADVAAMTERVMREQIHRGQDAFGMTHADSYGTLITYKNTGTVADNFDNGRKVHEFFPAFGDMATGQGRYSTQGKNTREEAHPFVDKDETFSLGLNGHLLNIGVLMEAYGLQPESSVNDAHGLTMLLERHKELSGEKDIVEALKVVLPQVEGAYCLSITDGHRLIGVRDPKGFRPLALGELPNGSGNVIASEVPAIKAAAPGAEFTREIDPGEILIIDEWGVTSDYLPDAESAACFFEHVYFSNKNNIFNGLHVGETRGKFGRELAKELIRKQPELVQQWTDDADNTFVVPALESGKFATRGFARQLGLGGRYTEKILLKAKEARTFILATQEERAEAVKLKHYINPNMLERIKGKRIVLGDDSLVRGTTTKALVQMFKEAGAAEVHLVIPCPPVKKSCFFGVDTGRKKQLLAAGYDHDGMVEYTGCRTLNFLSLEGMRNCLVGAVGKFCTACVTGEYPIRVPSEEVPVSLGKKALVAAMA